ncbi:hypothetical protein [Geothrix alkalitolerans]|uniref:hypothetical protein n=1 Tax=Geothrix alkalitolerans TaxID=2922724 RepID=UPI001FAEC83B|nr:hypothetical protein [Geothrix alkalitolerans]
MAEIRIATNLPSAPKRSATVYQLKAPVVNERTIRALAKSLGMLIEPKLMRLSSDEHKLTLSSASFELQMYRASGGFRFIDRARWQIDDGQANLDLSDEAALRTARELLKRMGLATSSSEARFLKAARLHVGSATAQGREASDRVIDVAVALQRMVDKVPVDGPGGKIVVYLDHKGRPTCIERLWRQIGAARRRDQACHSAQEAVQEMAEHLRSKRGVVTVEEVYFGYFEEGWHSSQRLLQPAYIIKGLVGDPKSHVRRKLIYVARALADAKTPLTPPLARKPKQRSRPSPTR